MIYLDSEFEKQPEYTSLQLSGKIMGKKTSNFFIVFLICLALNTLTRGSLPSDWDDLYFVSVGTVTSMMIWFGCAFIADSFREKISWTERPYLRLVLSIAATAVLVALVYYLTVLLWVAAYPNFSLGRVFRNLDWRDYIFTFLITMGISSILYGRGFFLEWKTKLEEAEKFKREKLLYQYEMLRNQVNPHFLFNNLSVLSNLVHKDADLAENFINKFSKVYRYVLDSRMKETVSIAEEVKHLEDYLFLMKIRFGDGFNFELKLDQNVGQVVPMTLQMLAENVFKHNATSPTNPVWLSVKNEHDYIAMTNNKIPRKQIEESGIGLKNIKERYAYLTEKQVIVIDEPDLFTVKIPLIS